MGLENYVSEAEAIQCSGVSIKTLQRFVEAGYLSVEVEPDGLRLYSRSQIDEIFGIHTAPMSLEPVEEDKDGNPIAAAISSEKVHSDELIRHSGSQDSAAGPFESSSSSASLAGSLSAPSSYYENPDATPFLTASTSDVPPVDPAVVPEAELTKLRNIVNLQEALLDAKDAELKDLRDERLWLRTRIEKLEEKGERDQILLLSETQTIRKLIVVQERKKSPVKQFLTWVGLLPEDQSSENTTQDLMRATPVKELNSRTDFSTAATFKEKKVANG